MVQIRELVQQTLNEIEDIEAGKMVPDGVIESGVTYFGYILDKNFTDTDYDNNYTYRVSLTGYLVRKVRSTDNTLEIMDEAIGDIVSALKGINFKPTVSQVTLDDDYQKYRITAYGIYNELNNTLII